MRPRPASWHVSPTAFAISAAVHGALAAAAIAMAGLFEPATPHAVVPIEVVFESASSGSAAASTSAIDAAPPAAAAAATSDDRPADETLVRFEAPSPTPPEAEPPPPELMAVAPAVPKAPPEAKPRPAREPAKAASTPRRAPAVETSARDSAPVPLTAALTSGDSRDASDIARAIDASKEGRGGLASEPLALLTGNPPPVYPDVARRRGWEGRVVLRVVVDVTGAPSDIAIGRTSGFRLLDESAIAAVQRWRFEPARLAGIPVVAAVEVPVAFRLTD